MPTEDSDLNDSSDENLRLNVLFTERKVNYMVRMGHVDDVATADQMWLMGVDLADALEMPSKVQWNVDDDNQHSNDGNLPKVDGTNHRRLIGAARKNISS